MPLSEEIAAGGYLKGQSFQDLSNPDFKADEM